MEFSTQNKSLVQPKTFAELLPGLSGILSKDAAETLTSTKKARPTMAMSVEKGLNVRPRTMAEMRADILALKAPSPKRYGDQNSTVKKWNSSVRVDSKRVSHTAADKQKHASVRKVLNFQAKPKTSNVMPAVTPKFIKPEPRAKKSMLPVQGKQNNIRISGVYVIPQTPTTTIREPPKRSAVLNKENLSRIANSNRKSLAHKAVLNNVRKVLRPVVPDTPLSNTSSDASFLQREKEINDEHKNITVNDPTLENIAEVSPPMSTPFKDYRSVHEYFMNDSSAMENSALQPDNTVMVFDKTTVAAEVKKEDSIIFSLCDLLNKATVTTKNTPVQINGCKEINELLEMEKEALNNIDYINNAINIMNKVRESHELSLKNIRRLIQSKNSIATKALEDKDCSHITEEVTLSLQTETTFTNEGTTNVSVIKYTHSPTYTIPRKNSGLKKKLHKSMPNSLNVGTPEQKLGHNNRAISMYMKIKENMNFLTTPVSKRVPVEAADTPAITSRNLQMQLGKLYDDS